MKNNFINIALFLVVFSFNVVLVIFSFNIYCNYEIKRNTRSVLGINFLKLPTTIEHCTVTALYSMI